MVILALLVQLVNPAELAKMVVPALLALPEMLVPQAVLAKLAVPEAQANLVTMVTQAVANTAHRLVWLQVIKRRPRVLFSGNTEYRAKSINSKIRSSDFFPKFISASCVSLTTPLVDHISCCN